jgi:hypothetical protein
MYASPLVTMQPMRWVSLLFGLIMFVWSSVFRFMHHKPENMGAYVDNQKCQFCEVVKMCNRLYHCVPLVEMVKKHIWNVQFRVRMRELCLRENVWTTGPRSPVLPVREGLAQIWTTGTTGPKPVLPIDGGRWRSLAWKWTTGTTGGAWPEVPVGVYSESDFQISNRFVSRSVFGCGKLRK